MYLKKEKAKIKNNEENTILIYKPLFDRKNNILLKKYSKNKAECKSKIIKFSSKKDQLDKMGKIKSRHFVHKDNLISKESFTPQIYFYSIPDLMRSKAEISKILFDIVIAYMA